MEVFDNTEFQYDVVLHKLIITYRNEITEINKL